MEDRFAPGSNFEDALSEKYSHVFEEAYSFEVTVNIYKFKDLAARDPKWFRDDYGDQQNLLNEYLKDCFDGFSIDSVADLKELILEDYPELKDCDLNIHFFSVAEEGLNFEYGSMTDDKHITDTVIGSFSVTCIPCTYYFHVHDNTFKNCVKSVYRK